MPHALKYVESRHPAFPLGGPLSPISSIEPLCVMTFQELEGHAVYDVEFEGNVKDISELDAKSETRH